MRQSAEMTDVAALMRGTEEDIARVQTLAMGDTALAAKRDFRDQITGAGLGTKLANSVRANSYPVGAASLDPAAWIYTRAGTIVDAYDRGATILPTNGRQYVAVPTISVPRRGRRRMTPAEVAAAFGQQLVIRKGRRGNLLAFVNVVAAKNQRGFRPASGRRVSAARPVKLVLMFILARQVRVRRRLNVDAVASAAQVHFDVALSARWAGLPDRTAPFLRRR